MDLNANRVIRLGDNKSHKVYRIGTIRLKLFNDCEFLICNVKYDVILRWNVFDISIVEDLGYCIIDKPEVLNFLHDAWI